MRCGCGHHWRDRPQSPTTGTTTKQAARGFDLRATLQRDAALRNDPELLALAAAATGEAEPDLELSAEAVRAARERGAVAVLPHALFLGEGCRGAGVRGTTPWPR